MQTDQGVVADGGDQIERLERVDELIGAALVPGAGGVRENDARNIGLDRAGPGVRDRRLGGFDDLLHHSEHPQRDGHAGLDHADLIRRRHRDALHESLLGGRGSTVDGFQRGQGERGGDMEIGPALLGQNGFEPVPGGLGVTGGTEQLGGLEQQPTSAGVTSSHLHRMVEHAGGRFDSSTSAHPGRCVHQRFGQILVRPDRPLSTMRQFHLGRKSRRVGEFEV